MSSPVDNLAPHVKDQALRMYQKGHEAQLNNFQEILSMLGKRRSEIESQVRDYQEHLEELHSEDLGLEDKMQETKNNIEQVQQVLKSLSGNIPSGMIVDPHTGLSLRIKYICGYMSLNGEEYVSVIFQDTDQCNRWISLEYILEDAHSKQLYLNWVEWKEKYEKRFPNAPALCRVTEFQAAIQNGTPPNETTADMYPVYQINKNGPKYHFKWFVNAITDKEVLYAVVIDVSEKRKTVPVYAFQKCDLALVMWNNWWLAYDELTTGLGVPLDPDEDYTLERLTEIHTNFALPQSALGTPMTPSPKKRRLVEINT